MPDQNETHLENPTDVSPKVERLVDSSITDLNSNSQLDPISSQQVAMVGLSEDRIRDELKQVIDPELFVNIVDLGLIYEVTIQTMEDGKYAVKVEMTMTSPMCPAGPQLVGQSQSIIENLEGVGHVEIKVVMDPPWTPDRMTEDARDQLGIF